MTPAELREWGFLTREYLAIAVGFSVAIGYSCPILQQLMSKLMSRGTPEQRIHGLAQKVKNRDRGFGHQLLTTEFFGHKLPTCSPHHSRVFDCTSDCVISPKLDQRLVSYAQQR
jgi:hypothetical protein